MAKSSRLYVLGLGDMLFAGYKADELHDEALDYVATHGYLTAQIGRAHV